jgi:hypothetical protein
MEGIVKVPSERSYPKPPGYEFSRAYDGAINKESRMHENAYT